jgi:nicotinate dehydrogenase subunit A
MYADNAGWTPRRRGAMIFRRLLIRKAVMPSFELRVNGSAQTITVRDANEPLLYVLRNKLHLTGVKFGCGLAQCGACTVLIDGAPARSCTLPVSIAAGRAITTIEGLGSADKPHPVQAAFIAEQAAQCGYCTNGMVMTAVGLLAAKPNATIDEAKAALAGNLCRCGTHQRILRAVMRAAGRSPA